MSSSDGAGVGAEIDAVLAEAGEQRDRERTADQRDQGDADDLAVMLADLAQPEAAAIVLRVA